MKKKRIVLLGVLSFLIIFVLFSYGKVEILTVNASQKLESFDLTCLDNIYCAGTPAVYDRKIYSYSAKKSATVLYILGDCEFGVMIELEWNHDCDRWELVYARNMWSVYGGSASEFYWPLYYGSKLFWPTMETVDAFQGTELCVPGDGSKPLKK